MHPYLAEQLVSDRHTSLAHEADRETLARAARASAPNERPSIERDERFALMPHVRRRSRVKRLFGWLAGASAA